MPRHTTRWIWIAAVTVAAALVVLARRPTREPVQVAIAGWSPLAQMVEEEGKTRLRDRYVVTAPAAGVVERIALREGASVVAGQLLAVVTPPTLDPRSRAEALAQLHAAEDAAAAAEAAAAEGRAALAQARRDRDRAEALARPGAIAQQERERAEVAESTAQRRAEAAESRMRAAAHDVELARAAVQGRGRLEVRAPVAGRVLRVPEPSARAVAPGEVLLEVGDARGLEVVTDLLSADAVQVHPGDSVVVDEWGGSPALAGRVRTVEPSAFTKVSALGVEEQRVRVVIDVAGAPPELGDGYRVEARIVVWAAPRVLTIPAAALVRTAGGWEAFVVAGGRASARSVEVGHRGADAVEILRGVSPGDTVVRLPSDRIADGVPVTVR